MCYLPQMLHSGCYLVKTLFNVIYLSMLLSGDVIYWRCYLRVLLFT